ncbi:MAG: hypothetical protein JST66_10415 [Bacteroidetes bacterium]|nr:hypothetical protein [Bacteroidota bacterium]
MNTGLLRPLLLLLSLGSALFARPQDDEAPALSEERMQEIKTQKIAFITQRLALTPEEARTFWPVYDRYDQEIEAVRKEMRARNKEAREGTTLTEAEAARILDEGLAARQRELDIRKRYSGEFRKTIGAVKTLRLARSERDFNRELFKRVREHRDERHPKP